jgi:hypothetical protein
LFNHRARYFVSELQRFIAEDPLDFGGGDSNLHSYVFNAPQRYTDPLGKQATVLPGVAIGGSIAGPFGAVVGGVLGGIGGLYLGDWIWNTFFADIPFPDAASPPAHWVPKPGRKDTWCDPTTNECWHWHPDPHGEHGGPHWDIGGPRPPGGGKGPQEWWPAGGVRSPKPPGRLR